MLSAVSKQPKPVDRKNIEIGLLGPMHVRIGGKEMPQLPRKIRALLAYIIVRREVAIPRESLTEIFWGDRSEEQARASLRQSLVVIKKSFGPYSSDVFAATRETVKFSSAGVQLDLEDFSRFCVCNDVQSLSRAVELFQGDLLEGLSLLEAPFEQWLLTEREAIRRHAAYALERVTPLLESADRQEDAIALAQQYLSRDPSDEATHRMLMRLFITQNRIDKALRQFERCRQLLQDDLNVEPAAETNELRQRALSEQRHSQRPAGNKLTNLDRLNTQPSIAIKPFENLCADPDQDQFADALSHGLDVALTRVPYIVLVSDETPSFRRSREMNARELGKTFEVRYVLRGSIHKFGDLIRVSAELLEIATGRILWAESYDRDLSNVAAIFAVQDHIIEEIVTAMDVKLYAGDAARYVRNAIQNPAALQSYYNGELQLWKAKSNVELRNAQFLFEEAIRLEPTSSPPYAAAALAHWMEAASRKSSMHLMPPERAVELARDAIRLKDVTGYPHLVLAHAHLARKEFEKASAEADLAVSARPSCPAAYSIKANVLIYLGRPREAIELAQYSARLTPACPPMHSATLARAFYSSNQHLEAVAAAKSAIKLDEGQVELHLILCAANAALGEYEEAQKSAQNVLKIEPGFRLSDFAKSHPYADENALVKLLDGLRSAGLE